MFFLTSRPTRPYASFSSIFLQSEKEFEPGSSTWHPNAQRTKPPPQLESQMFKNLSFLTLIANLDRLFGLWFIQYQINQTPLPPLEIGIRNCKYYKSRIDSISPIYYYEDTDTNINNYYISVEC